MSSVVQHIAEELRELTPEELREVQALVQDWSRRLNRNNFMGSL